MSLDRPSFCTSCLESVLTDRIEVADDEVGFEPEFQAVLETAIGRDD
jgi:hypothetical protein